MTRTISPSHCQVVTPEGLPLTFTLAEPVERAVAFLIDVVIIVAVAAVVGGVTVIFSGALGGFAVGVGLLTLFVVRHGYFIFFEARSQATPGKRSLGLRVIDRRGGPLEAEALLARNLTRELEVFLPLIALLAPADLVPELPPWARGAAVLWAAVFALPALILPGRTRIGDLLGGTLVVHAPEARLHEDLGAPPPRAARSPAPITFSAAQLDVYGIYELQVLEQLLRRPTLDSATAVAVAERIRSKIGWTGVMPEDATAFLQAFYVAQRDRLERRLQLGERRERKRH